MDSRNIETRRPDIANFESANDFLFDMYMHLKKSSGFSLRKRCREVNSCSQAYVSQILNRQRNITVKNISILAKIFSLTPQEQETIVAQISSRPKDRKNQNLLKNWFNPYVMELAGIKGFSADVPTIQNMLGGLINSTNVQKSIDFLFSEGFWKKSLRGQVSIDRTLETHDKDTSSFIVDRFHQRGLDIAKRGIDIYPAAQRKSANILLSLNKQDYQALMTEIDLFEMRLKEIGSKNSSEGDHLIQVTMHATPIAISTKKGT